MNADFRRQEIRLFICVHRRVSVVKSSFLCVLCGSNFLAPRHHHVIAARIHLVFFQRPWWWTTDVLSAQVVLPVMTGAPNLFCIVAVLDDALEVRAHG